MPRVVAVVALGVYRPLPTIKRSSPCPHTLELTAVSRHVLRWHSGGRLWQQRQVVGAGHRGVAMDAAHVVRGCWPPAVAEVHGWGLGSELERARMRTSQCGRGTDTTTQNLTEAGKTD